MLRVTLGAATGGGSSARGTRASLGAREPPVRSDGHLGFRLHDREASSGSAPSISPITAAPRREGAMGAATASPAARTSAGSAPGCFGAGGAGERREKWGEPAAQAAPTPNFPKQARIRSDVPLRYSPMSLS